MSLSCALNEESEMCDENDDRAKPRAGGTGGPGGSRGVVRESERAGSVVVDGIASAKSESEKRSQAGCWEVTAK